MTNITFSDLGASSEQIIKIEDSRNVTTDAIFAENVNKTIIFIVRSTVELMSGLNISHCSKALSIVQSEVKALQNSLLVKNGGLNNLASGGAIRMFNSNVRIEGTVFSNNTAGKAGAVEFE